MLSGDKFKEYYHSSFNTSNKNSIFTAILETKLDSVPELEHVQMSVVNDNSTTPTKTSDDNTNNSNNVSVEGNNTTVTNNTSNETVEVPLPQGG